MADWALSKDKTWNYLLGLENRIAVLEGKDPPNKRICCHCIQGLVCEYREGWSECQVCKGKWREE